MAMNTNASNNPHATSPVHDPEHLGELYDNNRSARNQADLKALQAISAEAFGAADLRRERIRLGTGPTQFVDLIGPLHSDGSRPTLVFVHGGRWQLNTSRETAFWARACARMGFAFAGLNFPPLSQARLPEVIDHVTEAVGALMERAIAFDLDPNAFVLAGPSPGAHLALASLLPHNGRAAPAWVARLRGLLLLGGLYDLAPLRLTSHQRALGFTADEARQCSPLFSLDLAEAQGHRLTLPPTLVAAGAQETPEFLRQSRALHWALQAHRPARWFEIPDTAHFDAALEFNREDSVLRGFIADSIGAYAA